MAFKIKGFGWKRDWNDPRDYTDQTPAIKQILEANTKKQKKPLNAADLKDLVENMKWCSENTDQGNLGSCGPSQGTSLFEYMMKKAYGSGGKYIDGSRLWVYKTTRHLMGPEGVGDSGVYIRTLLGAMRWFGIPPEEYWPYTDRDPDFDKMPTGEKGVFLASMAKEFKTVKQFRLDYSPSGADNIKRIKEYLAKGFAAIIGFMVFDSYNQSNNNEGAFPYPSKNERIQGGHAVNIVGYDNNAVIENKLDGSSTTGAFIIQNSWGKDWGKNGFGKIPYKYFETGPNGGTLAEDVWTITKLEWMSTGEFFW